MMFFKILMTVIFLSAVLSKESWAQKDEYVAVPEICQKMVQQIFELGKDAGSYEMFIANPNAKAFIYNAKSREDAKIKSAYEQLAVIYAPTKDFTDNLDTRKDAWKKCSGFLGKDLAAALKTLDTTNDPTKTDLSALAYGTPATEAKGEEPEPEAGKCVGWSKKETCAEDLFPLPAGYLEILEFNRRVEVTITSEQKSKSKYDPIGCDCLKQDLESRGLRTPDLDSEIHDEKKKLQTLVRDAVAKKFVNSYAALNEDMRYFSASAKIFENKGKKITENDNRLCQDPSMFRKAVETLCKANGTTEGSEERMANVLAAFDPSKAKQSFEGGFADLNDEINVLELLKEETANGMPAKIDRYQYDQGRMALEEKYSKVEFANRLITELLANKALRPLIKKDVEDGATPIEALLDLMSDPRSDSKVDKVLDTLKDRYSTLEDNFFSSLVEKKKNNKTREYGNDLARLFLEASQSNPTFKNLLTDNDLFLNLESKFNGAFKSKGLLEIAKTDSDSLIKSLNERCETVQRNFAEAVCTKPEEMLNNTYIEDVARLLKKDKSGSFTDSDAKDMAICSLQMNTPNGNGLFTNLELSALPRYFKSDYFDRKTNIPSAQTNGFHSVAKMLQNKALADKLGRMTAYTSSSKDVIDHYKNSSNSESGMMSIIKPSHRGETNMSSIPAPVNQSIAPDVIPSSVPTRDIASTQAFDMAKTVAPAAPATVYVPPTVTPAAADENKNFENQAAREKLARELGDTENKGKIKEHISSVNEKDAEEIFRLRDQAMKDRQTISDLRLQQERDKTEALRQEYEKLKARFDNLENGNAPQVAKAQNITSGGTGSSSGGSLPHFETASIAAPVVAGGSTGGRGATGVLPPTSSSMGGSVSLGDSGGGTSNAAGANASVTATSVSSGVSSESRGLALTVTQSVGADGKVKSVEDPNYALITYLTKNEPTIEQLQDLKTSGLVLTEEDISKDGQKVQTKKTFKFNELSPEAKNLVEKKLAQVKLQEVKRNYSRQALILELFSASKKNSNLNVKKSGSLNF